MIKFLFLTIPRTFLFYSREQCTYDQLKAPLKFKQDIYGVSTWTMKHPLTIYSSDLMYKHLFKQNEVKIQPVSNVSLQQKWKYFVITKADGGKYYCTSQIIYQKGLLKTSTGHKQSAFFSAYSSSNSLSGSLQFYLPKCIIMISELPYFKLQVNLLKIHKELKKKQPAISYCIQEDLYELYLEYLETGREKQWQNLNLLEINPKKRTYCPIQLSFAYYVECCNNHSAGQCIYIQKTSSRQVLHLYKLNPSSLYQIGYFFHLPFSAFSLRKIISAILTQKQIVFSSSNSNLTVMVIQTFMQIILPLKWCYMYAPNLPVELLEAAQQSFMPFIVGVSKQYLPLISKTNKIIVHIDTDQVEINYDQEQEELNLLSKKFQRFFTWKANSNKQYLEWQKELRINSILMITTVFKKDLNNGNEISVGKVDYFSQEEKLSQQKFYDEFINKSMMYRKLIEDIHENVYSEFYKLTKMDYNQRKINLQNKFNTLHSQTIYPMKCDNKKKWIKYYEKYMRQKRKSRLNRHSLSMVEHNLINIGNHYAGNAINPPQPFYGSNASLSSINSVNRIQINQTYQGMASKTFRSNINNNGNNQLYQSNISSHSLVSQASMVNFNVQGASTGQPISNNPLNTAGFNVPESNILRQSQISHKNLFFNTGNNKNEAGSYTNGNNSHYEANNYNYEASNNYYQNRDSVLKSNFNDNNYQKSSFYLNNNAVLQSRFPNINGRSYPSMMSRNNLNNPNQLSNIKTNQQANMSARKNSAYNSMILNNNSNPLNQSMVSSFISPNATNVNSYKAMANVNNLSSNRNLNGTQSTIVL